ncbi:hypothetical protein TK49_13035 [Ralstonia mannitolilytica]|uniref:endonuclease NucS domain-containing protein n=1 Tax=Ralstonia mannitolilytica TaxID=105219 RepID=UPI0005D94435|nr:endonuclease NucS domain-containing protein [Ralstonia mannitolilytica]AJW45543.1 hypothetical protein TK49_13035 [Ralstonia mannitolilytica]
MFQVDIANKKLIELRQTSFSELNLRERFDIQEWIAESPSILGEDLLVIGKEVTLSSGKRLDLLCIDKDAALVVVELKRDDSGSSVEWQAIKYASYCSTFSPGDIFKQYAQYKGITEADASKAIQEFIFAEIESLNNAQRIILVSKEFNPEVISAVLWLRDFDVDIQCTRLAPYLDHNDRLFIKPETLIPLPEAKDYIEKKEIKQRKISNVASDWTGYWFVNVGEGPHRNWDDNREFKFIGAGQGTSYSSALKRLSVGDKFYAYMKGIGYVGLGEVESTAVMIRNFNVPGTDTSLLDAGLRAERPDENADSEELSEYVVGVRWINALPREQAKKYSGIFANQQVVCKLRDEATLKYLHESFGT